MSNGKVREPLIHIVKRDTLPLWKSALIRLIAIVLALVVCGGVIVLMGSCREGLGERVFEEWMTGSPSPAAMIERIGRDFQLGGHKAAAIAMVLEKADIYLVSDTPPETVKEIFLTPFGTVQDAYNAAVEKLRNALANELKVELR